MRSDSDYPLSIFRDALLSTAGRIVSFLLVCCYTPAVTAFLLMGDWNQLIVFLNPLLLLGGAGTFAAMVLLGFYQVWGMIAHVLLIGLFYYNVFLEGRVRLGLGWTFLVLSAEHVRILLMTSDAKAGSVRPWRWILFLCVWAGTAAWLSLFARRQTRLGIPLAKRPAQTPLAG